MSANEIRNFVLENYYKQIGISRENRYSMKCLTKKDLLLLAIKLIKKIPDLCNAKEYDQSFKRKKITRSVKKSQIVYSSTKTF